MKQIWKGKLKIRIKRENPYYGTCGRHLEKVLFYRWGLSISLWTVHPDSPLGEFSDWAEAKLMRMFPGCKIEGHIVYYNGKSFYPGDNKWIFRLEVRPTENPQVFFDIKTNKYIGFSHRGYVAFGIGDILFDPKVKDISFYYNQAKYRRKYLWTLWKYHIKRDAFAFEDLCEDNIIGHGIMQIVPFKERGNRRIKNRTDAMEAAGNFAEYIS